MNIFDYARNEAIRQGVDPNVIMRLIQAESGGKQGSISPKGAVGVMQLMPGTAKGLGVNPNNAAENIQGGIRYLKQLLGQYGGDMPTALAAYNAGPGNVKKYGGIPPFSQTQKYISTVMGTPNTQQGRRTAADEIFGFNPGDVQGTATPSSQSQAAKGRRTAADEIFSFNPDYTAEATAQPQSSLAHPQQKPWMIESFLRPTKEALMGLDQNILHGVQSLAGLLPQKTNASLQQYIPIDKATAGFDKVVKNDVDSWNQRNTGGFGSTAAQVAGSAIPWAYGAMMAPEGLLGSAITGAGLGLMNPVTDTSGYAGTKVGQGIPGGVGGAVGYGASAVIGKVITPMNSVIRPQLQNGIDAAKRLGVQLTAGQKTGSLGLQQVEAALSRMPGATGRMNQILSNNKSALNTVAARSIGQPGDAVTEDVLLSAKNDIQKEFERIFPPGSQVSIGPAFTQKMQDIISENNALGPFANKMINDQAQNGLDLAAQGAISGPAYQTLRGRLGKSANAMLRNESQNPEVGIALNQIKYALDDAAKASLNPGDQAAYDAASSMWGNFKTLTRGNAITGGDVSPAQVGISLRQANRVGAKTGTIDTPLADMGRYYDVFKPQVPNSGTPERSWILGALTTPGVHAAAVLGSNALQGILGSIPFESYMTNGLLSPAVKQGIGAAGGLLGYDYMGSLLGPNEGISK